MAKQYDDKLSLEMPFGEALERFVGTKPREMHVNIKKAKKAKPPGGKNQPPDEPQAENVVRLGDRRKPGKR